MKRMKRLKKDQPLLGDLTTKTIELSDEQLVKVSGGLNPQPLPPGFRKIKDARQNNLTTNNNIDDTGGDNDPVRNNISIVDDQD